MPIRIIQQIWIPTGSMYESTVNPNMRAGQNMVLANIAASIVKAGSISTALCKLIRSNIDGYVNK